MVIVMKQTASKEELDAVIARIRALGYEELLIRGRSRTVVAAVGDARGKPQLETLDAMPGIEKIVQVLPPYKLVAREMKPDGTILKVGGLEIGGRRVVVMAGPCSVESRDQILMTAKAVKQAGATVLRGGAFKPRTSPYSFQGLAEEGLKLLEEARRATGLLVVTEVMSPQEVPLVARYADIVQIGARNMQNFSLLKEVGRIRKPIFLKRGLMSTIEDLLLSAEYILSEGNPEVILCERGIRTFETATRSTLDLSAVPVLKRKTHLPVFVDPSHGTGKWEYVTAMARAAVACGADGLMIEVHPDPGQAYSDGFQSLVPHRFVHLMQEIRPHVEAMGRTL